MGKWNHRRWTRKNYNQPPPPSPPNYFETEFKFRGAWKNPELPWEERFCLSVGIPWQKVVAAKNYLNCYENVTNWNDSGGKEAFYDAKKRFWSQINGLPCVAPDTDPNAYVDDVDWNLDVNPDLMLEVDREYFNPDEPGRADKSNSSLSWGQSTSENPWESSCEQNNGVVENVGHGWGPWDKSRNVISHNPWEDGNTRNDGATKESSWGCSDKLWGRTSEVKQTEREYNLNSYSAWENNDCGFRKSSCNNTPWNTQGGGGVELKQWKDRRENSLAWQKWENQYNVSNNYENRWHGVTDRPRGGGCLKRESSQQYSSTYKSSRYQGNDYGTNHLWKKQRNQNRVTYE